ncbi:hypothetical protein F4692_001066 [Nocardioides cavernae]|uniref:Uncharacterized protein n=1 Tax=Nocardioides cavernae TaxID=1921566 RepID=A0A7Y9H0X9_9ACTN|nr:hypothetical protein [Nocardioides cavernae]NYE35962.1 hypothetical protein [Nocardioides cavernae]
MEPAADTFRTVFDAEFDRCVTIALGAAEWQDEAFDAVAVAMVEVAVAIGAGEPSPWDGLGSRCAELATERRATRPGSRFLDQHLEPSQDVVRRPLGALSDALEDLDLDPGDTFVTPPVAAGLTLGLREAIATLTGGDAADADGPRRWWSRRR